MRRYMLLVPLLAITWGLLTADLSPGGLLVGGLLGAAVVFAVGEHFPWEPSPLEVLRRLPRALAYGGPFLKALTVANLQVAWILMRPRLAIRPGILAFRTRHRSDVGVTLLANSITLTPGTLTMEVSPSGDVLYVHVLDIAHPEEARDAIRRDLERYTLRILP